MDDERRRTVEEIYDAFRRRDWDALTELVDPDVEYVNPSDALEHPGERHRGSDRLVEIMRSFLDQFDQLDIEITEVGSRAHRRDDGRPDPLHRPDQQCAGTQIFAHVFRFRGPVVVAYEWYQSRKEAAVAAGVR